MVNDLSSCGGILHHGSQRNPQKEYSLDSSCFMSSGLWVLLGGAPASPLAEYPDDWRHTVGTCGECASPIAQRRDNNMISRRKKYTYEP